MGVSSLDVLRSRLAKFDTSSRYDGEEEDPSTLAELMYEQEHLCAQLEPCSEMQRQQLMGDLDRPDQISVSIPNAEMRQIHK